MAKLAVIKSGGKQYLIGENQEILVGRVKGDQSSEIDLEVLAIFDDEKSALNLGMPLVDTPIKATIVEHVKGDKVRISRFKSKVRYRKLKGFRPQLSKLKIATI